MSAQHGAKIEDERALASRALRAARAKGQLDGEGETLARVENALLTAEDTEDLVRILARILGENWAER